MIRTTSVIIIGALLVGACSGRPTSVVEQNEEAVIDRKGDEGEGEGEEGEGEGPARTLGARALFGTLPIDDRFLDPLFTLGGNGWFAVASDFSNYASFFLRAMPTPTETTAIEVEDREANPNGATVMGTFKGTRARMAVSIWLGRSMQDEGASHDDVEVAVLGTFVSGGDQAVDLEPEADTVRINGIVWTRFSVIMEEGPIGWANLYIATPNDEEASLFLAGASAQDVSATGAAFSSALSSAIIRTAKPRAPSAHERHANAAWHDRMRDQLRLPEGAQGPARPSMVPGLPARPLAR